MAFLHKCKKTLKTKAKSYTKKSYQAAFIIGRMMKMRDNSDRFKNSKRQFNINSDIYLAKLACLYAAVNTKIPRKKNYIVFYQDNARLHIKRRVKKFVANKE